MTEASTIEEIFKIEGIESAMSELANIQDERSFEWWLESLNRETETTNVPGDDYREIHSWRYFENGDNDSLNAAKREVCVDLYFKLSTDLRKNPSGKIVWRRKPEFDIGLNDQRPMPAFRSAGPCIFTGYMRYKIVG